MPSCFQLVPKGQTKAQNLADVDEVICKDLFHTAPNSDQWILNWYDTIGLRLAMGKSFEEIRCEFAVSAMEKTEYLEYYYGLLLIVDFIESHYDSNCWYEHR